MCAHFFLTSKIVACALRCYRPYGSTHTQLSIIGFTIKFSLLFFPLFFFPYSFPFDLSHFIYLLSLQGIFGTSIWQYKDPTLGPYVYPRWAYDLGWAIVVTGTGSVPCYFVYYCLKLYKKNRGSIKDVSILFNFFSSFFSYFDMVILFHHNKIVRLILQDRN